MVFLTDVLNFEASLIGVLDLDFGEFNGEAFKRFDVWDDEFEELLSLHIRKPKSVYLLFFISYVLLIMPTDVPFI